MFVQEQKTYFVNKLSDHLENGDPGDSQCAQIYPHPYCNFCERYFFNEVDLQSHLFKEHMTCTICGDDYKNWYYANYESLETHFDKTHFLCKNKGCLKSLFVAFKTEDELATHAYLFHQKGAVDKKIAEEQTLLGFNSFGPNSRKNKEKEEIKFKDQEAIDFGWYFSEEYKAKDQKVPGEKEKRGKKHNKKQDEEEYKHKPIGDIPDDTEKVRAVE